MVAIQDCPPVTLSGPETVSPKRLKLIEQEYNKLVALGYTPVDITDKKDEIVTGRAFNPEADTLMLPRLQGGRI